MSAGARQSLADQPRIACRTLIYQGNYHRAFVHVRDVVRALLLFATAPISDVRSEIFNVGDDDGNHSKSEIVEMICGAIPRDRERRELSFGGDMRDVAVSCAKIASRLGFRASIGVKDGIAEVRDAITFGSIHDPSSPRYRGHSFSVQ